MPSALILVGGYGTRLRPLTFSKAKPVVEFCNMARLEHQIEALVKVGVKKVVLAVSYKPEDMASFMSEMEKRYGITVLVSLEVEPMGTGA